MAVKLRASKVQPLAATTPTYLDYEGLVELVSKLKATYATQLSLDDYLTISAAASTYQPIGDYATNDTIYSLKSTILKQWEVHCEDGEMLSYNDSNKQLVLTSKAFGSDVDDDWGSRLSSSYTSNVYVRTICGEHIFGSTTDIDVASLIGLSSYALKTDIPTNVSAFTNDAGYITAADVIEPDLSNYVTNSSLTTTLADYAKTSDLPTLSSLCGVGTVTASGTSPLTLSAAKSGTTVTITGSVDLSSYVTSSSLTSTLADYAKSSDLPTLSSLSGIGTVTASGTSPLTLSASKSGTTVEITGSVDLSAYATTATLANDYYTKIQVDSLLEDATGGGITTVNASGTSPLTLSASKSGTTVAITGSVDLSAYATTSSLSDYVTSSNLTSTLADYAKTSELPTLSSLGGIGTVTASGTSPLTLSASKSGTDVTISGSVDLSNYATQSWVQEQIADAVTGGTVDLSAYLTKSEAASTYQPIGNYTTSSDFKTINGNSIIGSGDITIAGGGDVDLSAYLTKSEASSTYQPIGNYALASDIPTLSSLGGIDTVTASGSGNLSLSASKSGTTVAISGSVDLSDYATQAWVQEQITDAVTGGTVDLSAYLTKSEAASTYQPIGDYLTSSSLSDYAKTADVMESLVEIAESNTLSQNRDGVTLQLYSYYPATLGDANRSYHSDVTFKTVAGESIFGSGDIALDDFADKSSVISMANSIYRSSAMISTNNSNTAINFYGWEPSGDWLTGSLSNTTTINFKTVNGYPVIGSGDITIDSPGTATADELGLVRPWYDSTYAGNSNGETLLGRMMSSQSTVSDRYYGVEALNGRLYVNVPWEGGSVDLSSYATQAWVEDFVVQTVTEGTVDLTSYATKDDVLALAKNQYNAYYMSRSTSSDYTTLSYYFWYPESISSGYDDRVSRLYFANINGNSIVGTSSSQVSNLTISDLGGVSTSDLADYADKSGTMWLMELMARESELAYVKEDQRLKLELFYPDAWGETNMDESRETNVYVRTINGQHIFGDTSDIDVLPSDMTSLLSMQAQYPSATLLGMKETWFNTSIDNFNWVNAKIMDYDNETGSCRIRFGISDYGSSQTFAVRLIAAYSNEMQGSDNYYTALTSTTSGDCMAYFDLVVQYDEKTGSFPETYRKYYIEVDA